MQDGVLWIQWDLRYTCTITFPTVNAEIVIILSTGFKFTPFDARKRHAMGGGVFIFHPSGWRRGARELELQYGDAGLQADRNDAYCKSTHCNEMGVVVSILYAPRITMYSEGQELI